MRKPAICFVIAAIGIFLCTYFKTETTSSHIVADSIVQLEKKKKKNGYDEAAARGFYESEKIKDPALGYVPTERMMKAVEYTKRQQKNATSRTQAPLTWTERGPIYDVVGANGNSRGGSNYTAGRTSAILIDTLNDPTGNTVFCGAIAGGLWKCTNFLAAIPNWTAIDDRFDNLAISSISQDPSNASIMYFCTGEATSNSDAVYGDGVWKTINAGLTWTKLASSTNFIRNFKIVCDAAGNIYLASRPTSTFTGPSSIVQTAGLFRSKDYGTSWENITPSGMVASNNSCTDIEISSTGKLHASFGYLGTRVQHLYTPTPASVTSASWNTSIGLRSIAAPVSARRIELATQGDILYAVTINSSNNVDSCYKSIDGGSTWTLQNSFALTSAIANTQGWYNLTLSINPANNTEFVVGGLDAYKFTSSGTVAPTRLTFWVTTLPYVHADHHFMQWWMVGAQSRIVIGSDGGVFISNDGGATFTDKNRNLAIKQFYAGAIHPDAGSNYMLAGAQDNGVHQFTNPGLSWSTEVYGGDGCFVHINQKDPQIQFGSYVNTTYRRSTDGGTSWSSFTLSSNGLFVNPFDYDDGQNIMYTSNGVQGAPNNQILRWSDAHVSSNNIATLTLNDLTRGSASNASSFKVSPYTMNRVFIGGSSGKLLRLDNANSVTSANVNSNVTDITGSAFPTGFLNCVNIGSNDNFLVAVFSNYGVNNVWYSNNGGVSWSAIDGTLGSGGLPDMPVRWAVFDPQNNNQLIIATETGIYTTSLVNGSSTVWNVETGFPTVRTDMLKVRLSDNTIIAATHGRGLYSAVLPGNPEIRFSAPFATIAETFEFTSGCRGYKDYNVNVSSVFAPTGDAIVTYSVQGGSTATEGVDFDFTSNGNFVTPSKQHIFQNAIGGSKVVTIRIYDNASIESTKVFTIGFSITGSTNAYSLSANTYQVTITDNDLAPVPPGVGSATIGNGDYGGYIQPFRGNFQKARSQYIYLANELTAAGFGPGNITALGLNVLSKTSTSSFNGLTISLKATSNNLFSTVNFETGTTSCYSGNYSSVVGVNTFNFTTPFNWDGASNVLVEICYDNATIPGGSGDNVSSHITSDIKGIWNRAATGTGCALAAVYAGVGSPSVQIRPDIVLTGNQINNSVETVLNSGRNNYMASLDDVPFYNTSGKVIARIKNLGATDYGCTQVTVDRAGTGALPFRNNNVAEYLTQKTWRVVPTNNNTTGQYEITLFFTAAEKAGWETATGQSWNTIKIVKVKSQISNYTPANPNPDGAGSVEIVTPTLGTFGNDFTLKATFSSGFSGFAAGSPVFTPLPVTLLNFNGKLESKNSALLNWSTSSEQDIRNFEIEKSTDGLSYYSIGTVKAFGNSTERKDYSFRDDHLSQSNYYRLRMNDIDGKFKRSQVILLRVTDVYQTLWIVTNPFREHLDIRIANPANRVKLQLVASNGIIVSEKSFGNTSTQIHWDIENYISNGSYILRSFVDGQLFTSKVIKQ